ncbi:hypothetical protein QDY28_16130 [Rhizobium sp. BR 362]
MAACKAMASKVGIEQHDDLRFPMTRETIRQRQDIDLSANYRPIALSAVKAAVSVMPTKNQDEPRKDCLKHLLLPENLPEP